MHIKSQTLSIKTIFSIIFGCIWTLNDSTESTATSAFQEPTEKRPREQQIMKPNRNSNEKRWVASSHIIDFVQKKKWIKNAWIHLKRVKKNRKSKSIQYANTKRNHFSLCCIGLCKKFTLIEFDRKNHTEFFFHTFFIEDFLCLYLSVSVRPSQ